MNEQETNEHMKTMLAFALAKRKEASGMPAKSKAQSRFLNQKFGHKWVTKHHFGNSPKGLPEKAAKKSSKGK